MDFYLCNACFILRLIGCRHDYIYYFATIDSTMLESTHSHNTAKIYNGPQIISFYGLYHPKLGLGRGLIQFVTLC